jgi:hypothetical protein
MNEQRASTAVHISAAAGSAGMVTPPCHGCRHAARCRAERLACEAFVLFKRFGISPERWACAPRQPSQEIYRRAHAPVSRPVTTAGDPEAHGG